MAVIEIYTKSYCSYCSSAKQLLRRKGVDFVEIDLEQEPAKRDEMISRANGRTTVPQVFIDGVHVGGCDDLYALEHAGRLDPLIAA